MTYDEFYKDLIAHAFDRIRIYEVDPQMCPGDIGGAKPDEVSACVERERLLITNFQRALGCNL